MSAEAVADARKKQSKHARVLLTRWVLVIAIAYIILFSGSDTPPVWPNQIFVGVVLFSNALLTWLLRRGSPWRKFRALVSVFDIAAATLTIAIVGNASTDFYLIYFAVLMLAAVSHRVSLVAVFAALVCAVYVGLLYAEVGPALWRSPGLLMRAPFLFGVALFFGTITRQGSSELRALSEIGRLALIGTRPRPLLYEICQRVQSVTHVDRCSIVLFEPDGSIGYLAASSDDAKAEGVVMRMEQYPELQAALHSKEVTALRPGHQNELWQKVAQNLPNKSPYRSFFVVPIPWGESILGVLFLRSSDAERAFPDNHRDFCATAAAMVAGFIRANELVEKLRRKSREDAQTGLLNFQAFREEAEPVLASAGYEAPLGLAVTGIDNLRDIKDRGGASATKQAICGVSERLEAAMEGALIGRYGFDEFVTLVPASKGQTVGMLQKLLEGFGEGAAEQPCLSVGVAGFPDDGGDVHSLVEAASQARDLAKIAGGNRVCTPESGKGRRRESYPRAVLQAVEAAESAESAEALPAVPDVEHAEAPAASHLPEQLVQLKDEPLDSPELLRALCDVAADIESKNPYAKNYSRGVSELAGRLAQATGLGEEESLAIEVAALVHDFGKMAISDEVFTKDGKLTDEEREAIEKAPAMAAEMFEQFAALAPVVPIVLHHQERWDGSGYPSGLQGDDIPIGSQIVGICAVYRTLMMPRAYRPGLSEEQAKEIIERGAGRQWNPQVAKTFVEQVLKDDSLAAVASQDPQQPASTQPTAGAEVR